MVEAVLGVDDGRPSAAGGEEDVHAQASFFSEKPQPERAPIDGSEVQACLDSLMILEHDLARARRRLAEALGVNGSDVKAEVDAPKKKISADQIRAAMNFQEAPAKNSGSVAVKARRVPDQVAKSCSPGQAEDLPGRSASDTDRRKATINLDRHAPSATMVFESWHNLHFPVFLPEAHGILIWFLLGGLFIAYEAFTAPFFFAFDVPITGPLWVMASMTNTYFLCDICLMFMSAYYDRYGKLVTNPKRIAVSYLTSWFVFDALVSIPWEWFAQGSLDAVVQSRAVPPTSQLRVLRIMRFLRCMKMVKAGANNSIGKAIKWQMQVYNVQRYADLFKILALFLLLLHWLGCFWYFVGVASHHQKTWVTEYLDSDYFSKTLTSNHERYAVSIYFILTTLTTVGYGDTSPCNTQELLFTILLLPISWAVNASLISEVLSILSHLSAERRIVADKLAGLHRYMSWRMVPRRLQESVEKHLTFMWTHNLDLDRTEKEIQAELPPMLRMDLAYWVHGRELRVQPFLSFLNGYDECIQYLSCKVGSMVYEEGDALCRFGEKISEITVLQVGKVWVSQNSRLGAREVIEEVNKDEEETIKESTWQTMRSTGAALRLAILKKARMAPKDENHQDLTYLSAASVLESMNLPSAIAAETSLLYEMKETAAKFLDKAKTQTIRADFHTRRAAVTLQRRWRRMRRHRAWKERSRTIKMGDSVSYGMVSQAVHAPAYFGESCLWEPMSTWDVSAPQYNYNATCMRRTEVMLIARGAIEDMINTYQQWLGPRFEAFQRSVREGFDADDSDREDGQDVPQLCHQTWSHTDMSQPEIPIGRGLSHESL